jgi:enoyl-[acyl-carrier protein] reductase II
VIAAGGIYDGRSMLATMVLGAEGVQIGTRFIASPEASSHQSFKDAILNSKEGDTRLMMKSVTPVRLLINKFAKDIAVAENSGASAETLKSMLGKGRSKQGMFLGKFYFFLWNIIYFQLLIELYIR